MRVGIEVGGTFTDLVAVDGERIELRKVPSTPSAPDRGVLNALKDSGIDGARVTDMVHGSTVATNALLERKGAHVAFVTTAGFRDILFLQRHDRRNIYDLRYKRPQPVVQRADCFEVAERIDSDGQVLTPLDLNAVKKHLLPALKKGNYDAIAICLLSSYVNASHEEALLELLEQALPDVVISISSQVTREFREYERASTVTLAGYVQPVIDRYIARLETSLEALGVQARLSIMQSNGGRIPAVAMRRNAIAALFSGPAAGVVGAIRQVGRSGAGNLITFDMGGTSADVCLVTDGRPGISPDTEIDGLPVRTPVIDITTVGAGGGSIVWIDDGGMLRVGPTSAGAEPGPACYGNGGTVPTLTDAHVIRGSLRPEAFLGGTMKIDRALAIDVFKPIAEKIGLSVPEAASAALRLGAANIVRAIQHISTEQGKDPRDYALVPYGGAGPLLAVEIADELGVDRVIVPPNPGVLSAYGLIASDFARIYAATHRFVVDGDAADRARAIKVDMEAEARADFDTFNLGGEVQIDFVADMRFVGQAFEVPVELDEQTLKTLDAATLEDLFQQAHHRIFLHGGTAGQKVEVVGFRLTATRPIGSLPAFREKASDMKRPKSTTFDTGEGGQREAALYSSSELPVGQAVEGLALIEGYSSTIYLPDGWSATRDADDNLTLERSRT
ncbi:hydantoinase/oxoprolinase family protein [Rhodobacteraceae bacterium KMM 6894]|nr:hydantoinase/oxoprolinase family protein [Rhodobacteraceae bacterium KMM 6894]